MLALSMKLEEGVKRRVSQNCPAPDPTTSALAHKLKDHPIAPRSPIGAFYRIR